jgi:hypothetical protein
LWASLSDRSLSARYSRILCFVDAPTYLYLQGCQPGQMGGRYIILEIAQTDLCALGGNRNIPRFLHEL